MDFFGRVFLNLRNTRGMATRVCYVKHIQRVESSPEYDLGQTLFQFSHSSRENQYHTYVVSLNVIIPVFPWPEAIKSNKGPSPGTLLAPIWFVCPSAISYQIRGHSLRGEGVHLDCQNSWLNKWYKMMEVRFDTLDVSFAEIEKQGKKILLAWAGGRLFDKSVSQFISWGYYRTDRLTWLLIKPFNWLTDRGRLING